MLSNLPGSGIDAGAPLVKPVLTGDPEADFGIQLLLGVFTKFDQDELMDEVIQEIAVEENLSENDKKVWKQRDHHQLMKWGYVYYPDACVGLSPL